MIDDLCVLILSHRRPGDVETLEKLDKHGCSADTFIVVDDEDPTLPEYRERYGDRVVEFSKSDYVGEFDLGTNEPARDCVVYARNAAWDIVDRLGYDYFWVLDDDYTEFKYRFNEDFRFEYNQIVDLDAVLEPLLEYFAENERIRTICFAQGGDYVGGVETSHAGVQLHRKAMNSFLLAADRRFEFPGRINEDVSAYVTEGRRGELFFSFMPVQLDQRETQQNDGGLTGAYLDVGTYVKSFYSVMMAPSAVEVGAFGQTSIRAHHRVDWDRTAPKILSDEHRKDRG